MRLSENAIIIKHRPMCTKHKTLHFGTYNEKYDSYYCVECNRWLEEKCKCNETENDCEFFPNRPDKPIN